MSAEPTQGVDRALISLPAGSRGLTAFALALGTFMQVLDTTIANVSLPTIAGSLGVSPNQGTWVITSFAVANGISVPLTGWLMQRYGVVRTFVVSVTLFTLASFLCGVAWSFESLIAFRVMQGAVSGPMIPGSQTLLMSIFPASKRGTALAIWSMTTLVAPFVILALLGAVMSQRLFPRWYAVPLFAALAFFAVVSANRGYVETIGVMHRVVSLQTPLDIARASLRVSAADADTYRRVVNVVAAHARGPFVHAFPDCPEIYFLTDRRNPTPVNFEFFGPLDESVMRRLWDERHVTAIVLNHLPAFSPPPSASQLALARVIFPSGERIARFEVRWRALP